MRPPRDPLHLGELRPPIESKVLLIREAETTDWGTWWDVRRGDVVVGRLLRMSGGLTGHGYRGWVVEVRRPWRRSRRAGRRATLRGATALLRRALTTPPPPVPPRPGTRAEASRAVLRLADGLALHVRSARLPGGQWSTVVDLRDRSEEARAEFRTLLLASGLVDRIDVDPVGRPRVVWTAAAAGDDDPQ